MSKTKVIIPPDLSEIFLQVGGVANVETWQISGRFRQEQGMRQRLMSVPESCARVRTQRIITFYFKALRW